MGGYWENAALARPSIILEFGAGQPLNANLFHRRYLHSQCPLTNVLPLALRLRKNQKAEKNRSAIPPGASMSRAARPAHLEHPLADRANEAGRVTPAPRTCADSISPLVEPGCRCPRGRSAM